jgi:hypothetical protein
VTGPAELLRQIPAEYTLGAAIGIGSVILVGLVMFHGMGIHYILSFHKRGELRLRAGGPHISAVLILFGVVVFLLLALHIVGVIAWSVILTNLGLISKAKDAIYFCANAYTTLGYGEVDLDSQYRIISPIIGISGLFTFAWTASVLVNVIRAHTELIERLEEERAKEKQLRVNLKLAVRDARARESAAEREEGVEITQEAAHASLLRRWQLWREEGQKLGAIREGSRTETEALRRAERDAEEKLGVPPSDPDNESNPPPKA